MLIHHKQFELQEGAKQKHSHELIQVNDSGKRAQATYLRREGWRVS